jgi:hypothetical protein
LPRGHAPEVGTAAYSVDEFMAWTADVGCNGGYRGQIQDLCEFNIDYVDRGDDRVPDAVVMAGAVDPGAVRRLVRQWLRWRRVSRGRCWVDGGRVMFWGFNITGIGVYNLQLTITMVPPVLRTKYSRCMCHRDCHQLSDAEDLRFGPGALNVQIRSGFRMQKGTFPCLRLPD